MKNGSLNVAGGQDSEKERHAAGSGRIAFLAVLSGVSVLLSACGSKKYLSDIKAADYVTLGSYIGVEASAEEPVVEDGLVDLYIEYYILPEYITTVEMGDRVNIDFAGYIDGEPFKDGTMSNYELIIGSKTFLDGFETGLIGVNVGETVSLDLVFPDPYRLRAELSGRPVVFDVTVNRIVRPVTPQPSDGFIESLGIEDCKTWKELRDYSYNTLYMQAVQNYENEIESKLTDSIMSDCTFKEPPAEMVERYQQNIKDILAARAAVQGMTSAEYVQVYMGESMEDYELTIQSTAYKAAQHYIMLQAIADAEGLNPAEEQIQEEIENRVEIYHYESEEEYRKSNDVEVLEEELMERNVLEFLKENGKIEMISVIED